MLVHGRNLFPLNNIEPAAHGYFMDADGAIYSTRAKANQLRRLFGTHTSSGRYFKMGHYTHRLDHLVNRAKSHPNWSAETKATISLSNIDYKAPKPSVQNAEQRMYACDIHTAIRNRAVIIAAVNENGKLVFGTDPKMHVGEESYRSEMQRLASLKPGTKFVALQIVTAVTATGVQWE